MRLEGKTALVTGVDIPLGAQIAANFAREGARVAGIASSDEGRAPMEAIRADGGDATFVQADVNTHDGADRAVTGALDALGRIDILVNYNRVRRIQGTVLELDDATFAEQIDGDLKPVIYMAHLAIPAMAESGGGAVINVSSVSSDGLKGRAIRSASHAALEVLTISMALDHGPQSIRVNALTLGPVGTESPKGGTPPDFEANALSPIGQVPTPDQVAAAAAFLASDDAGAITGILLRIDGGRSLRGGEPTPRG